MIKNKKNAFDIFKTAVATVPAYKNYLKKYKINPKNIESEEDFQKLPVMDKKSYIQGNILCDLFPNKKIPPMISASSGSTGLPTFWFRGNKQEEIGGNNWEIIMRDIFKIKKSDQTLIVNCFSMGVWVAGSSMLSSTRILSDRRYRISTVTPGIETGDILNIFKYLAPKFKNLIILGYPPFLISVINDAIKRGIVFNQNIKIMTSGDKFSEEWRNSVSQLLNIKDHSSILSVYGSADAAMLGYETPLSIFLRKTSLKNTELYKEIFGKETITPGLYQHDENHVYFEAENNEIILTSDNTIPLIRYNIHDRGKVISHEEMLDLMDRYGLKKEAEKFGLKKWISSFVVIKGRTDVATTFYALNIYPENIRAGLSDKNTAKFITGNYSVYTKETNKDGGQRLIINIELAEGVVPNEKIKKMVTGNIVANLLKLNSEYKKLHSTMKEKAIPSVILTEYGSKKIYPKEKRVILSIVGKKPRIIS